MLIATTTTTTRVGVGFIVAGLVVGAGGDWEVLFYGMGILVLAGTLLLAFGKSSFSEIDRIKSMDVKVKPEYGSRLRWVLY